MAQMIHVLLWGMFLTDWSLLGSSENDRCGFHKDPKTWTDALRHCQQKHCSLVVMTNEAKKNLVKHFLNRQKADKIRNGVWIGLERSMYGCNVPWVWISGDTYNKDINSHANSSHHCGKIKSDGNKTEILSGYCFDKLPFICDV